jgi:hypothetical protein
MPSTESVSHEDLVLCACAARDYKTRDIIDAALWRGDLGQAWSTFLMRLEAEKRADEQELDFDDDELDAAAEAFRYERDLITAEETEQWLAARCLSVDEFSDYFSRRYWGTKLGDEISVTATSYVDAPASLRSLFATELILSGDLDWLTTQLMWRLAAGRSGIQIADAAIATEGENFLARQQLDGAELTGWLSRLGRDAEWHGEMQTLEAAYRHQRESVLLPQAYKHEISTLRLPLTRFETEVIEVESHDAAQEALFCVTEDGMSMEEVAAEGRYPFRQVIFLLEDLPPDLQQLFVSVSEGELLDPMPRGDGFEVCRVIKKIEPDPEDLAVQKRVEQRLLQRHFGELSSKYVERRLGAIISAE